MKILYISFAKGSATNYVITRVIRVNLENEDVVKIVSDSIYEYEQRESTCQTSLFWENLYGEEFICQHKVDAFGSYQEISLGRWQPGSRIDGRTVDENGQLVQDGRGSASEVETGEKINFLKNYKKKYQKGKLQN